MNIVESIEVNGNLKSKILHRNPYLPVVSDFAGFSCMTFTSLGILHGALQSSKSHRTPKHCLSYR